MNLKGLECLVGLVRVSTSKQGDKNLSLPSQEARLHKASKDLGLPLIALFREVDSATSGARETFYEATKLIERTPGAGLCVDSLSRASRRAREDAALEEIGALVYEVATGKLHDYDLKRVKRSEYLERGLVGVIDRSKAIELREQVLPKMELKATMGFPPHLAPFGLLNEQQPGRAYSRLSWDPKRAPAVVIAFEKAAQGYSLMRIARHLNSLGYKQRATPKRPERPLNKETIRRILHNTIYLGWFEWNGKTYAIHEDLKPIITQDLWTRAQEARKRNIGRPKGKRGREYLFAGVFECGICGCSMISETTKGHVYIHCTGNKGCHRCGIREDHLVHLVADELKAVSIPPTEAELLLSMANDLYPQEQGHIEARQDETKLEIERVQERIDALVDKHVAGTIGEDAFDRAQRRYEENLRELEARLQNFQPLKTDWQERLKKALDLIGGAGHVLPDLDRKTTRALLGYLASSYRLEIPHRKTKQAPALLVDYREPFTQWITRTPQNPHPEQVSRNSGSVERKRGSERIRTSQRRSESRPQGNSLRGRQEWRS